MAASARCGCTQFAGARCIAGSSGGAVNSRAAALHRFCLGRPCRIIPSGGKPYLVRVYLRHWADGSRTYLHRFVSRDAERWVHDHPFDGRSLVLSGGYVEEVLTALSADPVRYRRRWFNSVPAHKLHRIVDVEPDTWTLFHHGRTGIGGGSWSPSTPRTAAWRCSTTTRSTRPTRPAPLVGEAGRGGVSAGGGGVSGIEIFGSAP